MKCRICNAPSTHAVHGIRRNVVEQRCFSYSKNYCKHCFDKVKRGAVAEADVAQEELKEIV